jgi:hypothetical protein
MRGFTTIGVAALALAACRQTVVFDQTRFDGGGAAGDDGGPSMCSGPPTQFFPEFPEVIIALDRSSGMNTRLGDTTALFAARDALVEQTARYQKSIWFSYVDFPGATSSCGSIGNGCCAGVLRAPTSDFQRFQSALRACEATQSCASSTYQRPASSALYSASLAFQPDGNGITRRILLITNGRPDCGANQSSGCGDAQSWISDLAHRDIGTILIAPGQIDQDAEQCFQSLALADASQPQTPEDLANQVGQSLRSIATGACVLDVPPIQDVNHAKLYWKNTLVPQARADGWELTRQGFEIVVHGMWCDRLIEDGPGDFALFASCDTPRP